MKSQPWLTKHADRQPSPTAWEPRPTANVSRGEPPGSRRGAADGEPRTASRSRQPAAGSRSARQISYCTLARFLACGLLSLLMMSWCTALSR